MGRRRRDRRRVAELDAEGIAPPRLSAAEVRTLAEAASRIAGASSRSPASRPPSAARWPPGADDNPIAGDHAWIVRVRSPMIGTGTDPQTRLDLLWWLMIDDSTGRISTGSRAIAALPGPIADLVTG